MRKTRKPLDPVVVATEQTLRVYIKGELHLLIRTKEILGVQSWKEDDVWSIEFTLRGNRSLLCEYDSRKTWLSILRELDEATVLWS